MTLRNHLKQFGYDIAVNELRQLACDTGTALSYHSVMYLDIISYQALQGECTVSSLARALHISKSAVTIKIGELMQQGLVTKTQSRRDKRIYLLRVGDEVEAILAAYGSPFERAIERIEAQFSAEQIACFCQVLQTFSKEFTEDLHYGRTTHL
ncbi:MAG: MarR family transcriptional regulator [Pygmaiobacter sp.]